MVEFKCNNCGKQFAPKKFRVVTGENNMAKLDSLMKCEHCGTAYFHGDELHISGNLPPGGAINVGLDDNALRELEEGARITVGPDADTRRQLKNLKPDIEVNQVINGGTGTYIGVSIDTLGKKKKEKKWWQFWK